jgi:hypothetical protein
MIHEEGQLVLTTNSVPMKVTARNDVVNRLGRDAEVRWHLLHTEQLKLMLWARHSLYRWF